MAVSDQRFKNQNHSEHWEKELPKCEITYQLKLKNSNLHKVWKVKKDRLMGEKNDSSLSFGDPKFTRWEKSTKTLQVSECQVS